MRKVLLALGMFAIDNELLNLVDGDSEHRYTVHSKHYS
jgi:hypothetical protein